MTEDSARRELPRCKVTGNPCGTDTWAVGHPCQCESCVAYQRGREDGARAAYERVEAIERGEWPEGAEK